MSANPSMILAMLDADIDRALAFGAPGDKVLMMLSANSSPWFTADDQSQSVTMVVPADDDFHAEFINIFLSARKFNQADKLGTGTDLTFRPAMWVTTDNGQDPYSAFVVQDANATWKMSDTFNGTYQGDTGLKISTAYSSRYGQESVKNEVPLSAWPGSRRFFTPHKLRRGSTVTIGITPTFGRAVSATIKTQFRATVVLLGHKIIRRAA